MIQSFGHSTRLFGKSVDLQEVTGVRKFAGDYTLQTPSRKLKINTLLLAPDDLARLDAALGELDAAFS